MLLLPDQIRVVEVGPRDGLQSFPHPVDTPAKIRIIDILSESGFETIEVTGFVHPRAVPNLADAEAVLAGINRRAGVTYRALVPNARGAERAVAAGADEILGLLIVSRTYLARNQNMTRETALEQAVRAFEIAGAANRRFVMALGMAFWCPYEGLIPEGDVLDCIDVLFDAGIREFYLAGSVGLEDPRHVGRLFARLANAYPAGRFGYHVHDRGGFAAANVLAAIDGGASWLESSICGLGGGIVMPASVGDAGNIPTEDLVNLLDVSGIATGLDLGRVLSAALEIAAILNIRPESRALQGGTRAAVLKPSASSQCGRN